MFMLILESSLRALLALGLVTFPFFLPLFLHLQPSKEDEGLPNEVLWNRKRRVQRHLNGCASS